MISVNRQNAQRPGGDGSYEAVISSIEDASVCPFCPDHLERYHDLPFYVEAEHWRATDNKWPYKGSQAHSLIIHRAHIETLDEISAEAWSELQVVVSSVLRIKNMPGGTLLMRQGDMRYTGASVSHLHAQVVSGSGESDSPIVRARVG